MKKKIVKLLALALSMVMVLVVVAGCSNSAKTNTSTSEQSGNKTDSSAETAPKEKTVELSIAHIGALQSPSNLAVEYFIKLVDERSNGSIKITNYPASQLGGDRDILEGIKAGSIDMGLPAAGIAALFLPEYYIFDTPYMFVSQEHLTKVASGELGKEIADKFLEKNNIRVLTQNWNRGTRQSIFRKEVKDLPDFKGVKIRLPEIDSYLKAYERLGTRPTIVSFNETYSALQQGVVDGMECPLDWIYDNKFYEVCKHLVMTNHVYSVMTILINENKFQSMSEEQQKILTEASIEAGEYQNKILAEKESEYLEKMKQAGVKVYEPDLKPFIEAVAPMLPEYDKVWGEGIYEKVSSYK